ncbi:MAG: thiol:disulfide interchange protein [Dictyoglomus sp. NZ13-RE01]|nr:MAG: thiol:disulfide interchange protein [Dictyoglomus sp. NZ13-RE01]
MIIHTNYIVISPFLCFQFAHADNNEIKIGTIAINFSLPDLNGKTHSLKQYKGSVILLNFWATWCPPCRAEIPILSKIYKNYKKSGFKIIAVSLDNDINKVKAFLNENPVEFTVLFDKKGEAGYKYSIYAIPTSFLIDKELIIREIYIGMIDEKKFVSDLKKWLK